MSRTTTEQRLDVLEKRKLRKILVLRRDEVRGAGKKLHNEEPYNLHSSANITAVNKSRRMMGGACGMYMKENRCI
jgi:hypothetical protein